jgi:hypothetical protein
MLTSISFPKTREQARALIKHSIQQQGFHLFSICQGSYPRFGYTVGLTTTLGAELVMPGAAWFNAGEVSVILALIRRQLLADRRFDVPFAFDGLGSFTLRKAHRSWTRKLLLGALDHYASRDVAAYQVVPDQDHWTIDVPDLSTPLGAGRSPGWQWLREPWRHPVPACSYAVADLAALRGGRIFQAARWEDDCWEIFTGPAEQFSDDDLRAVPLGCFLARDPSLAPILDLKVGQGIWRGDDDDAWHPAFTSAMLPQSLLS